MWGNVMRKEILNYSYSDVAGWTNDVLSKWDKKDFEKKRFYLKGWKEKPVLSTLVLPVYTETREQQETALKIVKKTGNYVKNGYFNEIIVVEGSGTINRPNRKFHQEILDCAAETCKSFQSQLSLIKNDVNEKIFSERGESTLLYKVFSQKNPEYFNIITDHIGPALERKGKKIKPKYLQSGKGNGTKFAPLASKGDVFTLHDMDIPENVYGPHFGIGLSMPLFKDNVIYVKGKFIRKCLNGELGGRCNRLVWIPWTRTLSKQGILPGLEQIRYGLSGEFAGSRKLFNKLVWPEDYRMETGINIQVYREVKGNLSNIAQVDLGLYKHDSSVVDEDKETGKDPKMENMAREITEVYVYEALDSGLALDEEKFLELYKKEVGSSIKRTKEMIEKSRIARERGITYGEKMDRARAESYEDSVRNGIKDAFTLYYHKEKEGEAIPSLESIMKRTNIMAYEDLKKDFYQETIKYNLELLEDTGLI